MVLTFLVGKAGAFISKPDFAVGRSLDVLVNGYGAVLVGYDTSRHRVLDVGYGTADVGIQRAVFKGTVAVRSERTVFQHQVVRIAKRLLAL